MAMEGTAVTDAPTEYWLQFVKLNKRMQAISFEKEAIRNGCVEEHFNSLLHRGLNSSIFVKVDTEEEWQSAAHVLIAYEDHQEEGMQGSDKDSGHKDSKEAVDIQAEKQKLEALSNQLFAAAGKRDEVINADAFVEQCQVETLSKKLNDMTIEKKKLQNEVNQLRSSRSKPSNTDRRAEIEGMRAEIKALSAAVHSQSLQLAQQAELLSANNIKLSEMQLEHQQLQAFAAVSGHHVKRAYVNLAAEIIRRLTQGTPPPVNHTHFSLQDLSEDDPAYAALRDIAAKHRNETLPADRQEFDADFSAFIKFGDRLLAYRNEFYL